jgi:hypothetical protein
LILIIGGKEKDPNLQNKTARRKQRRYDSRKKGRKAGDQACFAVIVPILRIAYGPEFVFQKKIRRGRRERRRGKRPMHLHEQKGTARRRKFEKKEARRRRIGSSSSGR